MKSTLQVNKIWGLVQMMSGLANPGFSLPEWQAVKMIFFVPCCIYIQFVLIVMADEATNIYTLNLFKIDKVFDDLM